VTEDPLAPHSSSPAELKERIEAERLGMPFLLYRDGGAGQQIYTLEDTATRKITVGRAPDADVVLGWDAKVSGLHAELERIGADWAIVDDGLSRNGTFVNGERLHGRRRLEDGDMVRCGDTVALFRHPLGPPMEVTMVAGDTLTAADLSEQQRKVLIALCRPSKEGTDYSPPTNQEIADELFLSVDAVKLHLRALFDKFGVADLPQNKKRLALVGRALQSGLISWRDL
jgi:pSer/pThr/pTyr-binding forkhead associated (FHA) protein